MGGNSAGATVGGVFGCCTATYGVNDGRGGERGGVLWGVGGGGSTSKNRPSHHKYKSSKQGS